MVHVGIQVVYKTLRIEIHLLYKSGGNTQPLTIIKWNTEMKHYILINLSSNLSDDPDFPPGVQTHIVQKKKMTQYVSCFKRKEFYTTLYPIKSRTHILFLGFVISWWLVIPVSRVIKLPDNMWPRQWSASPSQHDGRDSKEIWLFNIKTRPFHDCIFIFNVLHCNT